MIGPNIPAFLLAAHSVNKRPTGSGNNSLEGKLSLKFIPGLFLDLMKISPRQHLILSIKRRASSGLKARTHLARFFNVVCSKLIIHTVLINIQNFITKKKKII